MTFTRSLAAATLALISLAPVAEAATVNATGNVTNNVIFGSGVTNGSFTGVTVGGLELALRAKLRYDNTSACGGVGCAQNIYNYDGMSTYTFDSSLSHTPANRSLFNFEWAINSNANGTGGALNSYSYRIDIDTDPDRRAEAILLLGDPERAEATRALVEQIGGERGESALARRIGRGTGTRCDQHERRDRQ